MGVPVKDAAAMLGVSERRVLQLVAGGQLEGRRVGERMLLLDDVALEHYRRQGRSKGRPYSERSAWAVIDLLLGRPPSFALSPSELSRARHRAANLGGLPSGALRARARIAPMRGHAGVVRRLTTDARILQSGAAAAREHRADIIIIDDMLSAYVSSSAADAVVSEYRLRPVTRSEANVLLRIAPQQVPLPGDPPGVVPAVLLALDLIDDGDERSVRAGHLLLAGIEATHRADETAP